MEGQDSAAGLEGTLWCDHAGRGQAWPLERLWGVYRDLARGGW